MNGISGQTLGYCAGVLGLVALGWVLTGQAARPTHQGQPMDWSHRHVIFSQPSNDAQAAAVIDDPRYWQQFNRLHFVRTLNAGELGLNSPGLFAGTATSHGDWAQSLGTGANAGAGVYPAKYSFQIDSASCGSAATPDYVVFSTGLFGSTSKASIVGFDNLYSGCGGIVPTVYWAFNTAGQVLTSPIVSPGGTQIAAGSLDPEDLDGLAGERIGLRQLGRRVAAPGIGNATVCSQEVRAVHQPLDRVELAGARVVPGIVDVLKYCLIRSHSHGASS